MNKSTQTEKTAETFVIALHQGKTFVGFYTANLPSTDRSKAHKFTSFDAVKQGAAWISDNWFRIYGYNVTPLMLTNGFTEERPESERQILRCAPPFDAQAEHESDLRYESRVDYESWLYDGPAEGEDV